MASATPSEPVGASSPSEDDDVIYVPGLAYTKVAILIVAFAVLAGAIGWRIGNGTPPGPGSVDVGFLVDMRTHHQQAVEMALTAVDKAENPIVRSFAREILIRQNVELGLMAAELGDWGNSGERPEEAMGWMGHPVPWRAMPGLATDEQMEALRSASGAEFDAMFLELMAEHHRGGVHMASYAAENAETDDVRRLAARMAELQRVEIAEFRATAEQQGIPAEIPPYEGDPYEF